MNIQLKIIINHQFVFLHTCTQKLFHTQHISEMQEIFRRTHNNKRQYFIEPYLISISCKRDQVWLWFLSSPLVLSRLNTAGVTSTSRQDNILSFFCGRICAVLNWLPPVFALFCLQLALWRNCDIGAKRVYNIIRGTISIKLHLKMYVIINVFVTVNHCRVLLITSDCDL